MTISIIVAVAGSKRVIGRKGGMPWHLPEELKRFKEITSGHPIIMGRKTFESIGRVLSNRTNIIITRDSSFNIEGAEISHSLADALKIAQQKEGNDEIFIIGGGQIYQEAIGMVDKLYLTYIDREIDGDTFFPDYSAFKQVSESDWQVTDGIKYKFLEFERQIC